MKRKENKLPSDSDNLSGEQKKRDEGEDNYMVLGMSLGMLFGLSIGQFIFDNTTLGMCIGMSVGLAVGANIKKKKTDDF